MFRGHRVARVFFVLPLLLAGCASVRPVVLSGDHPANPAAPEAPTPRFTTLQTYRAPQQFASQTQPDAARQQMPGMGHGQQMPGMDHGSMPHGHAPGTGAHGHGAGAAGGQPSGGGQSPDGAAPTPQPSPGSHGDSHSDSPGGQGDGHDHGAGGHGSHHGGPYSAAGQPGRPEDVSRTIRLEARDIAFDVPALTVRAGETIRFVVTNVGRIPHEFAIGTREEQAAHRKAMAEMPNMVHDDPNVVTLRPGETKELVWRFAAQADIEFACNIPGHAEAGMRGDVRLVGATAEGGATPPTSVSR